MFIPEWLFLASIIFAFIFFISLLLFYFIRRHTRIDVLKKHHDVAGFALGTLGTLYSVYLGFTIVSSQDHFAEIISQVNNEAYLSADLLRLTIAFEEASKTAMQQNILAYLKSVVIDEWPLMSEQTESPITLAKLEEMWKPYYAFQPKTDREKLWFAESLDILTDLNSARLKRIYSSWESLGIASWIALIAGGIIVIGFLFFFGTENPKAQILINSLFLFYVILMIVVIYSLDDPFRPPYEVEPSAYKVIYNYYTSLEGKPPFFEI